MTAPGCGRRERHLESGADAGMTLVELVVYMVLLVIVLAAITMIFANMWRTQAAVDAQTRATSRGQLVTSEIEKAMRNATGFSVTDAGATLLVQTSLPGTQQCQAFHFDPSGGTNGQGVLRMVVASAPAPTASSGYAWQDGIKPFSDGTFSTFFTYVNSIGTPVASTPAGVHYSFSATASSLTNRAAAVTFLGTAYPRNASLGGTSTCWP